MESTAEAPCLQTRCWSKGSAGPEYAAGRCVQVLSFQLPEGTRCAGEGTAAWVFPAFGASAAFEPEARRTRTALAQAPSPGWGSARALPAPSLQGRPPLSTPPAWARPRACVTAGPGAESGRAGHPAQVPRRARPLPAARSGAAARESATPARAGASRQRSAPLPPPGSAGPSPRARPQPEPASRAAFGSAGPAQAPAPGARCSPAR